MSSTSFEHVRTRTDRGVAVITIINLTLRGDDLCDELKKEMLEAREQSGTAKVALDLQYVKSATSRALGTIAGFYRELVKEHSGEMALCGLSPLLREAMSVCRFIADGTSASLVSPASAESSRSDQEEPKGRTLFQIVTADVDSAVQALTQA